MKNKKCNFITSILLLIMIIIFLLTVYFCLDVFGIINVPKKYSIASILYSQIEGIASGENLLENIISTGEKKIVVVSKDSAEVSSQNVKNPLEELDNSEKNTKNIQNTYDTNKFYYNQLDEYGKLLYTELYANKEQLKTGTFKAEYGVTFNSLLQEEGGNEILSNALDGAINALVLDNPEIFYIDITKMYLVTNITKKVFSTTYNVSISGNGNSYLDEAFTSTEQVEKAIKDVKAIKDRVIDTATGSTVDKIKTVHDYLVDSITYDANNGSTVYNIYGALVNQKVVCEGYAKAFKYILDDLGIPCIIVCGTGTNSSGLTESHAWNYVQIEGKWYALDVTWDDPVTGIPGGYVPTDLKYSYFLKGSEEFFENHVEDESMLGKVRLNYPYLSQTDY